MFTFIHSKLIDFFSEIRIELSNLFSGYQTWIKPGIIIFVLLFSVAFAFVATPRLALYVLLLIAAIVFAIIYLRNPHLGIIAIIFAALLVPSPFGNLFGGFLNTAILSVAFFSLLWIIDMFVRQRHVKFASSKTMVSAIVFMIVAIIAFINAQIIYTDFGRTAPISNQIGGLGLIIISIVTFILISNQLKDVIWLRRMSFLFIGMGFIYIFLGRIAPHTIRLVIHSLFQYGSDACLFWTWLVAIVSSQVFFNQQLKIYWRLLLIGLLLATFYVSLTQAYDWKSGWVPPGISLVAIMLIGSQRLRLPALLIGFFVIILGFTNIGGAVTGGEAYSLETRFPAWNIVLEIVKLNPILGIGIANYYWYTPIYNILGYSGLNFSSHNNYIDILAQMGIVGLFCFLWFFWEVGRLGWKLKDKVPGGFTYAYTIGALGGIIGTLASGMLGDWILPFVYNVGLHGFRSSIFAWLFPGGLVVLEQLYMHKENKEISK